MSNYILNGVDRLREFVQQARYLMVNETTEFVGAETKEGKAYKKKYLWAFFVKHIKMVYYHYNNGSRVSDSAKSFLEYFREQYPLMDIQFTGCMMEKSKEYFI